MSWTCPKFGFTGQQIHMWSAWSRPGCRFGVSPCFYLRMFKVNSSGLSGALTPRSLRKRKMRKPRTERVPKTKLLYTNIQTMLKLAEFEETRRISRGKKVLKDCPGWNGNPILMAMAIDCHGCLISPLIFGVRTGAGVFLHFHHFQNPSVSNWKRGMIKHLVLWHGPQNPEPDLDRPSSIF